MRTRSSKAARLADVARLAKVSTATVSRALTLPHKVKARTLERVQQAARSLGYVAHGAARALASRRTHTIGAVVPTLDNAIFANTIHALQRTLDAAGYVLLLASHEFDADIEARVTRTLIERGVDGLVLLGTTHHPDIYRMIESNGVPYVLTWAFDESGNHPCVGFDNRAAAVRITDQGPGLSADERKKVGQRFYRVLGNIASGSGLGLSIIRRIAELHGGTLELMENTGAKGLTAELRLPLHPAAQT